MKSVFFGFLLLSISCTETNSEAPLFENIKEAKPAVTNESMLPEISIQTFNQLPKGMEGSQVFYYSGKESRSFVFIRNDKGSAFVKVNGKLIQLKRTYKESNVVTHLNEAYNGGGYKATIDVKRQGNKNKTYQYKGTLTVTNGFKKVSKSLCTNVEN